jgi:hypothetical protein
MKQLTCKNGGNDMVVKRKKKSVAQKTIRLPPIPPQVRAQFPALKQKYPQLRSLTDNQIWLVILRLRQQQLAQQAQQQAQPTYGSGYGSSGYGYNNGGEFTGLSSGLYKW